MNFLGGFLAHARFRTNPFSTRASFQNGLTFLLTDQSKGFRVFSTKASKKLVTLHFKKERTGEILTTKGKVGSNFYDVVIDNDIDLDGFGACEGTMACVTCHLIYSENDYKKLAAAATEDELDMLDMAIGLSDTSRLGCQVNIEEWMDGMVVTVPADKTDARTL